MFSFRTTPLDRQEDVVLRKGRLGVLCNQSAWNPETGEYLFESLSRRGNLKKIFYPASGIFGELDADFTSLSGNYSCMGLSDCEFVPLQTGAPLNAALLGDIDALIVEYQDTGSRYDSMTALLHDTFRVIDSGTLRRTGQSVLFRAGSQIPAAYHLLYGASGESVSDALEHPPET